MDNIIFICCDAFGFRSAPTWLNVINYGTIKNNVVSYTTKDGDQIKPIAQIEVPGFIKCFTVNDIDFEKSLYHYFSRINKVTCTVEIDQSITTGEVYYQNCWRFKLMIQQHMNTLKVKILFD